MVGEHNSGERAGAPSIDQLAGTELPGSPAAADQQALEGTDNGEAKQYKTLGIRVDNELHAKLSFITQLRESTLSGEIVAAIRERVDRALQDPDLIAKAAEVRAQIEAEARARQAAISGMFWERGSTKRGGGISTRSAQSARPEIRIARQIACLLPVLRN